ncbi:hypothetical protein Godav_025744 [Gossypium davidsonii]|uniref:Uncharacterized protein n=2 Tax=Gossypium TaxID=3633 RepID=A0A7J8T6Q4_GOSDV|nr:hypothetical protein [Gossypium davidsonii]MBA0666070.1 hypothetical protein [Gossypium klotzschianum]
MIGPVIRIDACTDAAVRGLFTRLVVTRRCVSEQIDHDGNGAVQGGSEVDLDSLCERPMGGETRVDNHTESVNLDGVVGLEASATVILVRKGSTLDERKLARSSPRKEGVAVDRDFGVRKRDVRVKGKRVSVSLGPKASGRVLKPSNSGAVFSSKKVVSGFVVGDLLGCVGMDGSLGQENFKVVSLKPGQVKAYGLSNC